VLFRSGLGLVEPGTPTNNTDLARSGYRPEGPEHSQRYREVDGTRTPVPPAPAAGPAARLAWALDLNEWARDVLGRQPGAAQVDAQADMNALVWASSWGYFLLQILEGVSLPTAAQVRRHFIDHVRGGGLLPVLRIGDQPYGVLPVVSLKHWANREGGDVHPRLVNLLRRAMPAWVAGSWKATVGPRWPLPPAEPILQRYFRLLATQASAVGYVGRSTLGPEYIGNLWRFLHLDFDSQWRTTPRTVANDLLRQLGLPADQRHTGTVFAEEAYDIPGPTLGAAPATYLTELLSLSPAQLAAAAERGATPLLYRVARHSALQEWWTAVLRVRSGDRRYVEDELVDLDPAAPPAMTLWRALAEPAPPELGGPAVTVGQYLQNAGTTDRNAADLREFESRVASLAAGAGDGSLPEDVLDRLLRGSLDLAAHRLDAWVTSYAHRRLEHVRAPNRRPAGLMVGGFGWVANLYPTQLTPVSQPPPDEPAPLYTDTANAGHVLAPSLQHAITAAILHAGYVARGGRAGKPGAVAVNLSAERVRLVRHLVEGVRAGQPLNALLGYRFERALAEGGVSGVPAMILPFRVLAPFTAQALTADGSATEVTRLGTVADGVELVRRWHAGEIPWGTEPDPVAYPGITLPAAATPEHAACEAALALAADGLDALADATLAEGVHHLAAGNPTRAGAVLDALGKGESPPPDLDVIRTPRSGAVHTHRLLFLGNLNYEDINVWRTDGRQVRAHIEPVLNGWAGRMLGDPARVRCRGVWYGPAGATLHTAETTFDQLAISPLDLLALAGPERAGAEFELRQRFVDSLRHQRPPQVPDHLMPVPGFGRQPGWGAETLSVSEFLQMAGAVRAALLGARALREEDLAGGAEQPPPFQWQVKDMGDRANWAVHVLRLNRDLLTTAADAGDIGAMGGHLASLAYLGVPGSFPEIGRGWDEEWREELRAKSRSVLVEVERRLADEAALRAGFDEEGATDQARVDHRVARLRAVLGPDHPVAPTFRVADPTSLGELFSHSSALLDGDPLAPATWLDRLARVRAGPRRLHTVFAFAEATGAPGSTDLAVAQVPFVPGERWVALPPAGAEGARRAPPPRTALAVHGIRPVQADSVLAGLLFDEWTEMVPGDTEVAGLTFHYDTPSARAPQALLLAVPPGADGAWSVENLRDTVAEAFAVARARAVDLPILDQYGHLLPALYFALNETGATVSTDFTGAGSTP
jgi:hypothetical protein